MTYGSHVRRLPDRLCRDQDLDGCPSRLPEGGYVKQYTTETFYKIPEEQTYIALAKDFDFGRESEFELEGRVFRKSKPTYDQGELLAEEYVTDDGWTASVVFPTKWD